VGPNLRHSNENEKRNTESAEKTQNYAESFLNLSLCASVTAL
jgi:hypothetical protein